MDMAAIALAGLTPGERSDSAKLIRLRRIEFGEKIDGRDAKRRGQVKQGDYGWIAATALQIAYILLGKARRLGKALLGKALIFSQLGEVESHEAARADLGTRGRRRSNAADRRENGKAAGPNVRPCGEMVRLL